jgi:hypothetical protein
LELAVSRLAALSYVLEISSSSLLGGVQIPVRTTYPVTLFKSIPGAPIVNEFNLGSI